MNLTRVALIFTWSITCAQFVYLFPLLRDMIEYMRGNITIFELSNFIQNKLRNPIFGVLFVWFIVFFYQVFSWFLAHRKWVRKLLQYQQWVRSKTLSTSLYLKVNEMEKKIYISLLGTPEQECMFEMLLCIQRQGYVLPPKGVLMMIYNKL